MARAPTARSAASRAASRTALQAAPRAAFAKVRGDHAQETAEDYCEAIAEISLRRGDCRVRDLAALMEVTHVTVTKILARLARRGLVTRLPYGPIGLTARGTTLARASRERHAVVAAFLRAVGVPAAVAERDAEGLEHHASAATLRAMRRFLDTRGG